jgi:hypothetical protein
MNSAWKRRLQHHCGSRSALRDSKAQYYTAAGADRYGARWKLFLSKQGINRNDGSRAGVHKMGHLCWPRVPAIVILVRICVLLLISWPCVAPATDAPDPASPMVEGIECNGNSTISCELIRARSAIAVGRELDDQEIESARLRLEALPNVRTVRIHLIKGSRRRWVVVVIDVREASPLTTAFSAGTLGQLGQSAVLETLAARITDHNLFNSGKVLDLAMVGAWPIGNGNGQEYATRLQYIDPQLFGSRRYFLVVGGFYSTASFAFATSPYGQFFPNGFQNSGAGFDSSVGMRFGTYSYVTVGYRYLYLRNTSSNNQYLTSDGVLTTLSAAPGSVLLLTAGRNTEDDPFFPTRGWLLHAYGAVGADSRDNFIGVTWRATWRAGANAFWTVQTRPFDDFRSLFDGDLGVSIAYSHTLFADGLAGRRSRWFVGPGVTDLKHSLGPHYLEVGVKAGVRFETRYLGTVNLYVIATHLVQMGN